MTNYGYCSRYEWAKYILEKTNWQGEIIPVKSEDFPLPAKRPNFSVLNNFPLKYIIGYNLPSWREATREVYEYIIRIIRITIRMHSMIINKHS